MSNPRWSRPQNRGGSSLIVRPIWSLHMKTFPMFLILVLLMIIPPCLAGESQKHSFIPKDGFVPDKETAIRIAEAVWIPIYGEEKINSEKPFKATLSNGVWMVEGSLPEGFEKGGVAIAEIAKKDGRIIRVSHGK